ncbi:MAG: UMP kinase [Candidatus Sungbacteria bacterium]|nr:UMP kinase [Candidatus Sungbacteria bacterium]
MAKPLRVLLKISGEALSGEAKTGYNLPDIEFIAREIKGASDSGGKKIELAVVVGGGNLIRGARLKKELGLDSVVADYAGMLATLVNAVVFQDILEKKYGLVVRVLSAIEARQVAEPYLRRVAMSHLEKGRVVLLAGGTGNPDFSTDTAMVLRAHEIEADMVLKGTKVSGIFDKDPKKFKNATKIPQVSYMDYLNKHLEIVDATAVTLARQHNLSIQVFDIFKKGNLKKAITGEKIGSVIKE